MPTRHLAAAAPTGRPATSSPRPGGGSGGGRGRAPVRSRPRARRRLSASPGEPRREGGRRERAEEGGRRGLGRTRCPRLRPAELLSLASLLARSGGRASPSRALTHGRSCPGWPWGCRAPGLGHTPRPAHLPSALLRQIGAWARAPPAARRRAEARPRSFPCREVCVLWGRLGGRAPKVLLAVVTVRSLPAAEAGPQKCLPPASWVTWGERFCELPESRAWPAGRER